MWMGKRVLVVMVCERTGHVLVGMVLHGGHSAVVRKEGIGGRSWGMGVIRRPVGWMSCPGRLVLHLPWMLVGGELVGNARGLLRIVHGIGGESRHSEAGRGEIRGRRKGGNDYGNRERRRKSSGGSLVVVKNSERGMFVGVAPNDDEHSYTDRTPEAD